VSEKVLIVDDDTNLLAGLKRQIGRKFDVSFAEGGEQAVQLAKTEGPFAAIVSDMNMPGMNGIELLLKFKQEWPDTIRMMLTGNADQQTAIDAVNQGNIYRFFNKPCSTEKLTEGLNAALTMYRLITAERVLLEQTLAGSVKVMTDLLSVFDASSFGSADIMRQWARKLTKHLDAPHSWKLDLAAMLSPIGRVAVPLEVLVKQAAGENLEAAEKAMIDRAPGVGKDLISNIPRMEDIADIIYYQNKKYDGSGFPEDDVAGDDIPIEARILRFLGDLYKLTKGRAPSIAHLEKLKNFSDWYCPKVLEAAEKWLASEPPPAESDAEMGTVEEDAVAFEVPSNELKPGHFLLSNVETLSGDLILQKGIRLSRVHVERVRNVREREKIREPIKIREPVVTGKR